MPRTIPTVFAMLLLVTSAPLMASEAVDLLLSEYHRQGAGSFSASVGKQLFYQTIHRTGIDTERSCTSCHTRDLRQMGRHAVTGKEIKPLAPSALSRRLTNPAKIRKWLRRNCLWTRGRECTPQEKGDLLTYLKDL